MIAQDCCTDVFYPNSSPLTGQNVLQIDCFGIPDGTEVTPSPDDINAINSSAAKCWPNYWYNKITDVQ